MGDYMKKKMKLVIQSKTKKRLLLSNKMKFMLQNRTK